VRAVWQCLERGGCWRLVVGQWAHLPMIVQMPTTASQPLNSPQDNCNDNNHGNRVAAKILL